MRVGYYIVAFLLLGAGLTAQETSSSFGKITLGIGSGFPGLLALDELIDGKDFGLARKASPPLHLSASTPISRALQIGIYAGYEYESASGTIINFPGNHSLFIIGVTTDWYFLRKRKPHKCLQPFAGVILSYSRIDFNEPIDGFLPSFRLGVNWKWDERWGMLLKVGYGSAIGELSVLFTL